MNRYARWFQCAVWFGVLANLVLAVPGIFAPNWTLSLARQTTSPHDALWISFASAMLVALSIVYLPGANDPYRYKLNAWLSILARAGGVLFFFVIYPGLYPAFGLLDLTMGTIQLPLLLLAYAHKDDRPPHCEPELAYEGSTFKEVKSAAFEGIYRGKLPYHMGVTPWTFLQMINHASRNLSDPRDILPPFNKLLHSNGICYSGVWRIDQASPYTGYFAKGSEGLCLARLSVAGLFVSRGLFPRAFAIAGKLFPTLDPYARVKPANFVTIDHLSGTWLRHMTDARVTNCPSIGLDPAANFVNRVIFRLMDTRPGYRQLHPISSLGLKPGDAIVTPDLIMLQAADGTPRIDKPDFRNEMRLANYPRYRIVYTINVKNFEESDWTRLGTIEFTEDAISEGGDKRLHFWIPRDCP